jgi:hypothetical protein
MGALVGLLGGVFGLAVIVVVLVLIVIVWGYNRLRRLAEEVHELHSHIALVAHKNRVLLERLGDTLNPGQVQAMESELHEARARYNTKVRDYNIHRTSFPQVLYGKPLGFRKAGFLHLSDEAVPQLVDDGEGVHMLLAAAGSKVSDAAKGIADQGKNLAEQGKQLAQQGKVLAETGVARVQAAVTQTVAQPAEGVAVETKN